MGTETFSCYAHCNKQYTIEKDAKTNNNTNKFQLNQCQKFIILFYAYPLFNIKHIHQILLLFIDLKIISQFNKNKNLYSIINNTKTKCNVVARKLETSEKSLIKKIDTTNIDFVR